MTRAPSTPRMTIAPQPFAIQIPPRYQALRIAGRYTFRVQAANGSYQTLSSAAPTWDHIAECLCRMLWPEYSLPGWSQHLEIYGTHFFITHPQFRPHGLMFTVWTGVDRLGFIQTPKLEHDDPRFATLALHLVELCAQREERSADHAHDE